MDEQQLAAEALRVAASLREPEEEPEAVVKRAEVFYTFLLRSYNEPDPTV